MFRKVCYYIKVVYLSLKEQGLNSTLVKIKRKLFNSKVKNAFIITVFDILKIQDNERLQQVNANFSKNYKFSIIVPIYNTPIIFLKEMIDSVKHQTYNNWELCLADGSDEKHLNVEEYLNQISVEDSRVKYVKLSKNKGIAENTNECLKMAIGEYIVLFDHDDILSPSALYELATAVEEENADLIYTDEAVFESNKNYPINFFYFKPDFAIDNLRSLNYICHLTAFSRSLYNIVGGFRSEFDGSQDHDMVLRLAKYAKKIVHIPKLLYFWRAHPNSVAQNLDSKAYAVYSAQRAIESSLLDYGITKSQVESLPICATRYHIKYQCPLVSGISIIINDIVSCNECKKILQLLRNASLQFQFQIIFLVDKNEKKCIEEFIIHEKLNNVDCIIANNSNIGELRNKAASFSKNDYLLFLSPSIILLKNRFLEELIMYMGRTDVGIVAGKVICNNRIINGGVYVNQDCRIGIAYENVAKDEFGYVQKLCYVNNITAVTDEFFMIKKGLISNVGGYDSRFGAFLGNIDLCLKLRDIGLWNVWTPFSEIEISRQPQYNYDSKEFSLFKDRWAEKYNKTDSFYNRNLDDMGMGYLKYLN